VRREHPAASHLALIVLIWAGIYLPTLGSLELRGEEGRRILPGLTMLQTSNWIVPYVGGQPYLRKPPMVNWLVAISTQAFGRVSEWSVRAPSVLAVLLCALGLYTMLGRDLGPTGSFLASIGWLTTIEVIDKGRLIEIDALYASVFGLALVLWIFGRNRSIWFRYIVPAVPLGFGLLLKGPLLLLFFYAIVLAEALRAGRWRELRSSAHLSGIVIFVGLFALWAVPHLLSPEAKGATQIWSNQVSGRVLQSHFSVASWLANFPRALFNFLPWLLILFLPARRLANERDTPLFFGLKAGTFVCFWLVMLIPGSLPRYTLPLAAPICILAAQRMTTNAQYLKPWKTILFILGCVLLAIEVGGSFLGSDKLYLAFGGLIPLAMLVWFQFEDELTVRKLSVASGALAVSAVLLYSGMLVPRMKQREVLQPRATAIASAVPASVPLYAVNPGPQPVFFYLQRPLNFVPTVEQLPPETKFVLTSSGAADALRKRFQQEEPVFSYKDQGGKSFTIFRVGL
jgi:4-amino-4-deoxy-L-arabinose transferase-like glycosyltransferase